MSFQKNYQTQYSCLKEDLANLNQEMQDGRANLALSQPVMDEQPKNESNLGADQKDSILTDRTKVSNESNNQNSSVNIKQKYSDLQLQINNLQDQYKGAELPSLQDLSS